jgi:hypothetical protein
MQRKNMTATQKSDSLNIHRSALHHSPYALNPTPLLAKNQHNPEVFSGSIMRRAISARVAAREQLS